MGKNLALALLVLFFSVDAWSQVPPVPTGLTSQCSADALSVVLQWAPIADATYALRVDDVENNSPDCLGGWYCADPPDFLIDSLVDPSRSVSVIPGKNYNWWVHGQNAAGYSEATFGAFLCVAIPLPTDSATYDVDLTFTLNWSDNSDDELEFWIYRNMGFSPPRVGVVGKDATTFVDHVTKIYPGQDSVCYQVLAVSLSGESEKSEPVCGWTGVIWQPEMKAPSAAIQTEIQ